PMKGPMVTQTLRGLNTLEPFHWRGDRTNFLHFSGAFDTLLGGTAMNLPDMQAFRDFVNTIRFEPNPNRQLNNQLPITFAGGSPSVGKTLMDAGLTGAIGGVTCSTCHIVGNTPGTDRSIRPGSFFGL